MLLGSKAAVAKHEPNVALPATLVMVVACMKSRVVTCSWLYTVVLHSSARLYFTHHSLIHVKRLPPGGLMLVSVRAYIAATPLLWGSTRRRCRLAGHHPCTRQGRPRSLPRTARRRPLPQFRSRVACSSACAAA